MSDMSEKLKDYEEIRLAHIRRNHEFMAKLGLFTIKDTIEEQTKAEHTLKKKPTKAPSLPEELRRRSSRVRKEQPEFTFETIDLHGDKLDALAAKTTLGKRNRSEDSDFEETDIEAQKDEVREAAMLHMRQVREAMLPTRIADEATAAQGEWREEAIRRWGDAAGAKHRDDWKAYVTSRLSSPPPVSPLDMLQEYYAADTWRLLVSCILMSRVSSWATKHTCISNFFSLYATPSDFFAETDWSRVKGAIHSLGLFEDRLRSLSALTSKFIESDIFEVSPDPKSEYKIHGIGAFGYESYLVFCKDSGPTIKLSNGGKPLAPFVAWRKKQNS